MTTVARSGEGEQTLRNMSAPPRSAVTLHPFQVPAAKDPTAAQGAPTNWGLAWYVRVNFDWVLEARWPRWSGKLGDIAFGRGHRSHLRLCGAVALARIQDGIAAHPQRLEARLCEELGDELLRRAPGFERALALPPLMMATRASQTPRDADQDPARTLAILTHLSGQTCDPAGSPLLSEALREGHALDLWIAEAAHA